MPAKTTRDGYTWTPESGITSGNLETDAVIVPPRSLSGTAVYDAIVIGAGYAGLLAVRDLTLQGFSVLLLEARDRIGGRTYSVKHNGLVYEMGGTWVTHHMGYLFREMVRYGMDRDLITTGSPDMHKGYYTMNVPGATPRTLSHEEAGKMTTRAWDIFVNVDGQYGRTICPLPHAQLDNPIVPRATVEEWDKLSCQDRFAQIQHQLTAEEQGLLVALLLHISGGTMENSSLWDMIRSHALLMHSSDNFNDVWLRYKLREGQTALAKRIFDEALEAGLEYVFSAEVKSIVQSSNSNSNSPSSAPTTVQTTSGEKYQARKVISTIPLNVLKHITFAPKLPSPKRKAITLEHVNHMTKLHADVAGNPNLDLSRWNGMRHPANLTHAYADGILSTGAIHLTAFGSDQRPHFIPEQNPELAVSELKALHPDAMAMDVKQLVFHNWSSDPYARGGPAWWRPGLVSRFQEALQARHGDVLFASADWAHGWRAAIDGAMEQGVLAARVVAGEIKQLKRRGGRSKL
ncbi:hypothetical protein BJY00DRAFT_300814 [Aspergillus carlsbadensis]|nr:hypothetical protein BJY00DRAFT_300814 [Aspergillus carlsbadensis]